MYLYIKSMILWQINAFHQFKANWVFINAARNKLKATRERNSKKFQELSKYRQPKTLKQLSDLIYLLLNQF